MNGILTSTRWSYGQCLLLLSMSITTVASSLIRADEVGNPSSSAPAPHSFRDVAKSIEPSVVSIRVLRGPRKTRQWALYEADSRKDIETATPPSERRPRTIEHAQTGNGSGIIIDRRGFILTCYHVVESAEYVSVELSDGRILKVRDVREDPESDLAVLMVDRSDETLTPVELSDSANVAVGDWVLSVGNPYGLGKSVSAGIVSATDRALPDVPWTTLIQSDAASNPGNSGGALVNLKGEIVGICEGSYGAGEGFQGIGLAFPVEVAKRIAEKLIEHGTVRRAYLGCHTEALSVEAAKYLEAAPGKLLLVKVTDDSPAANAGLRVGDVLESFAGVTVRNDSHMRELLEEATPGRSYQITIRRSGRVQSADVILEELRPHRQERMPVSKTQMPELQNDDCGLGVEVHELDPRVAVRIGLEDLPQVVITRVQSGGLAYQQGLCAGMSILQVGNRHVSSAAEYDTALKAIPVGSTFAVLVGTPTGRRLMIFAR